MLETIRQLRSALDRSRPVADCRLVETRGSTPQKAGAIAAILNVTPRTVAYHKYRMMDELTLETNAELIQFAIKQGLVSN